MMLYKVLFPEIEHSKVTKKWGLNKKIMNPLLYFT